MSLGLGGWGDIGHLPVGQPGQPCEDFAEISVRVESAPAKAFDDGVDDGAAFAAGGVPDEGPVLLPNGRGPDGVFHEVMPPLTVVGGLLFTAFSIREETKTRRISNLLNLTSNHREIWSMLYRVPELDRVLRPNVDLRKEPVTLHKELLVNFVFRQLDATYHAIQDGLLVHPEGMRRDVAWFFSLPIPHTVWEKFKPWQDAEFVAFVEGCRG